MNPVVFLIVLKNTKNYTLKNIEKFLYARTLMWQGNMDKEIKLLYKAFSVAKGNIYTYIYLIMQMQDDRAVWMCVYEYVSMSEWMYFMCKA